MTISGAEVDILGYHYAQVGAELLAAWQMPGSLIESVRYQVEPALANEFPMGSSIVHIASVLTRLHKGELNTEQLLAEVAPIAWDITGLNPEDLPQIRVEAMTEVGEVISMMLNNDLQPEA